MPRKSEVPLVESSDHQVHHIEGNRQRESEDSLESEPAEGSNHQTGQSEADLCPTAETSELAYTTIGCCSAVLRCISVDVH